MTTINNQQLQEINAVTLKKWLDKKEALLIDVREPSEFAAEHISLDALKLPILFLLHKAFENFKVQCKCV